MTDRIIHQQPPRRVGLIALAGLLVLAACGGDGSGEAATNTIGPATTAGSGSDDRPDATTAATEPETEAGTEPESTIAAGATGKPVVELPAESPAELVVTDLVAGSGEPAEVGDTVELHYVGVRTEDGTEFDNSFDGGVPFALTLGRAGVIPGFEQGLMGVRQGGRRQMDIPAALAYGDQGAGAIILPGDAITFVVEIVSVTKPVPLTVPPMADPSECPATDGSEEQRQEFDAYPPFCIDVTRTYTADIVTNFGEMSIEFDAEAAPYTVNSFVTLARYKYFDDTECHRAIPDFVVQCGDPTATGTGGPGYMLPDELSRAGEYQIGSIAMANTGQPNSGGSQFFIITGDRGAALPPQYSLFGEVVGGLDSTVTSLDAVANPENDGRPPLEPIIIESVTITET